LIAKTLSMYLSFSVLTSIFLSSSAKVFLFLHGPSFVAFPVAFPFVAFPSAAGAFSSAGGSAASVARPRSSIAAAGATSRTRSAKTFILLAYLRYEKEFR